MIRPIPLAVAGALALSACAPTTVDPFGADPNRTRQGAGIGAASGAVAGAILDDDEPARGALIGAIAGGLGGGAIGSNLDRQEAALRASIGGDGRIGIVNTGSSLVVTMPQDILFATGSAALQPALVSDLQLLARNLQQYVNTTVNVIGHTDNVGTAAFNQDLSGRRAQAVAQTLVASGVAPSRVQAFGRGEDQPLASNLSPEGRAQNRRVEIVITPAAA